MKNQQYYFAGTPPPGGDPYTQITDAALNGINWGNSVGLGVFGILMALSIVAYLFKK